MKESLIYLELTKIYFETTSIMSKTRGVYSIVRDYKGGFLLFWENTWGEPKYTMKSDYI